MVVRSPSSSPTAAVSSSFVSSYPPHRPRGGPQRQQQTRGRHHRRSFSLLAVVGTAAAYLALYGLILVHKIGIVDDENGRRRDDALRQRPTGQSSSTEDSADIIATATATAIVPKSRLGSPGDDKPLRTKKSKNAYSYLLAGCDPDQPGRYRAYWLGVAVSMHALRSHGSTADFHVYVELLHGTNHTTLLPKEERLLTSLGATLHYITPDPHQSFYRSQLYKFLILNLTEYDHVFYLDSDVLPLSNLDYMFDAIDHGVLRRNVAFLGKREPSNGGTFILSPRDGALRLAHGLIVRKEKQVWNDTLGWGVDASSVPQFAYYTNFYKQQSNWDFFGADGDQGFLYYWIKFVEKDATFISNLGEMWHWGPPSPPRQHQQYVGLRDDLQPLPDVITSDTDPSLLPTLVGNKRSAEVAMEEAGIRLTSSVCFDGSKFCGGLKRPRRDFFHFTGDRKPWHVGLPDDYGPGTRRVSINHYWFSLLEELNEKHRLGLDFAQEGGSSLAALRSPDVNEAKAGEKGASGNTVTSSSSYEIRYKQQSGPNQVYTRLIRDDESDPVGAQPSPPAVSRRYQEPAQMRTKNAYAFLIGACDPDRPSKYRYFLYSVMVIVRILQTAGSTADFHLYVEMFHLSVHDRLPDDEERVLHDMGVTVHYIGGKRPGQSFYALQLQKFRILDLHQYRHVMYLDSDIIPVVNLDFVFDWIDGGILNSNVGFVGHTEPMNGGTFVLSPREGAVEQINKLIYQKEHRPWNTTLGWGRAMIPPDRYLTSVMGPRTMWDFHGGDTDQGLLYYWTKYAENDVSMILKNFTVEHWSAPTTASPLHQDMVVPVRTADYAKSYVDRLPVKIAPCVESSKWCGGASHATTLFIHLTGNAKSQRKPWLRGLPADYGNATKHDSVYHFWFAVLDEINVKHRLGIDLWQTFGSQLPASTTVLVGYNDAFKQQRVDAYTSIID